MTPNLTPDQLGRLREQLDGRQYHIVTYGCQMNAHDSETIAGMLEELGMRASDTRESSDLIIYNTCCVRDNAERRALGNVGWLKELKRDKPGLIIGVCGCMVQQAGMADKLLKRYPFVDVAFGTHNLPMLQELLYKRLCDQRRVSEVLDIDGDITEGLPIKRNGKYQAYVTIMYGCNNFCSYCIVPYVRGRERSRKPEDVLREIEQLKNDGVMEIMLLGQNVNSYGGGEPGAMSFATLLREIDQIGIPRVRFMTSHPKDLSDELIAAMADCKSVCKQLHLPVQAGSDALLKAMNRRYTREQYLSLVKRIRAAMPDIGLTTDTIVGFPGETDADFEDTLSLVKEVCYDSAYTFIYSPREGTRAAEMPCQIDPEVSKERIHRLIEAQEAITAELYASLVGNTCDALIEGESARGEGQLAGRTERGITVNFIGDAALTGQIRPVRIVEAGHNTLKGTLIQ